MRNGQCTAVFTASSEKTLRSKYATVNVQRSLHPVLKNIAVEIPNGLCTAVFTPSSEKTLRSKCTMVEMQSLKTEKSKVTL